MSTLLLLRGKKGNAGLAIGVRDKFFVGKALGL